MTNPTIDDQVDELAMRAWEAAQHRCPGCRGISGDAVSMERHEQSCILALRAAVATLSARVEALEAELQARSAEREAQEYWLARQQLDAWNKQRGG